MKRAHKPHYPSQGKKGPHGRSLCYCGCGREVRPPRRNWFGEDCITKWRWLHDWQFIRERVLERDKGVCRKCGRDCLAVQFSVWQLWKSDPTRKSPASIEFYQRHPGVRLFHDYWQADHIRERVDGGTNEMVNLQTLCLPCHKTKTARSRLLRA